MPKAAPKPASKPALKPKSKSAKKEKPKPAMKEPDPKKQVVLTDTKAWEKEPPKIDPQAVLARKEDPTPTAEGKLVFRASDFNNLLLSSNKVSMLTREQTTLIMWSISGRKDSYIQRSR